MKSYVLDANVALRFLLADNPTQSPAAKDLFIQADKGNVELILNPVTLAEIVWVLDSFYEFEHEKIGNLLCGFVLHEGVVCPDEDACLSALSLFAKFSVDFADCYVAASAHALNLPVLSYDRDFKKFSDISCLTPDAALKSKN
jgi:predicted nucleic-acid-binding protein